jgi:parvulin-like peptidyl-prolyl isomerase
VTRNREDAEKLALQIFERAKAGEDFAAMVKTYTNDSFPGIYKMSNRDVPPDTANREFSRTGMVKAFGDVSFSLEVGGVGLAVYDPATSKYGWHIIKRLE